MHVDEYRVAEDGPYHGIPALGRMSMLYGLATVSDLGRYPEIRTHRIRSQEAFNFTIMDISITAVVSPMPGILDRSSTGLLSTENLDSSASIAVYLSV